MNKGGAKPIAIPPFLLLNGTRIKKNKEEKIMTGQHFKEILETVIMSTKTSKETMIALLNISRTMINIYLKNGVPIKRVPLVMAKLRSYLSANIGGC